MKYLIYFFLIVVVFSINVGVFGQLKFFGATPDLLLLLIIFISADKNSDNDFLPVAFFSGLLMDVYSGLLVGSFTVPFLLAGLSLYLITEKVIVYEFSWKYAVLLAALATFGTHVLMWGYGAAGKNLGWFPYAIGRQSAIRLFFPELAYNILLLYPVYQLTQWAKRLISKIEVRRRRLT